MQLVTHNSAPTDTRGAGTDANVTMELFGEKGSTGERKLDSSANDFERGKVRCACMYVSVRVQLHSSTNDYKRSKVGPGQQQGWGGVGGEGWSGRIGWVAGLGGMRFCFILSSASRSAQGHARSAWGGEDRRLTPRSPLRWTPSSLRRPMWASSSSSRSRRTAQVRRSMVLRLKYHDKHKCGILMRDPFGA